MSVMRSLTDMVAMSGDVWVSSRSLRDVVLRLSRQAQMGFKLVLGLVVNRCRSVSKMVRHGAEGSMIAPER